MASSGNHGTGYTYGTGWYVTSPGTSWNVLTVGGVNDGTGKLWYVASAPKERCGRMMTTLRTTRTTISTDRTFRPPP